MEIRDIVAAEARYLVPTYRRPEPVFERGEGAVLVDADGRRYLDFTSGIAVMSLGHGDPDWVAAVTEQAQALVHVSNLYHTAPHVELARRLVERSFADRVFFCNSGAEANEAALKFARKWARSAGGADKTGVVAFEGGFHGRTLGALSLTHKAAYREPFAPLVPDVRFAPFDDLAAAAAAISERTCAVFVEPVQGEGGVRPASDAFLAGLRALCDRHGALLVFDEVQCGLGRTGSLWAHELSGVAPDIMTLAKPLAGGLPIGAALVTEAVADAITPGDHGSTFAAGPLVCRAATVVLDKLGDPALLANVRARGAQLRAGLRALPHPGVVDVRGRGLLLGLELDRPVAPVVAAARARGLLLVPAGERVVRLAPPLTVTEEECAIALVQLAAALNDVLGAPAVEEAS